MKRKFLEGVIDAAVRSSTLCSRKFSFLKDLITKAGLSDTVSL